MKKMKKLFALLAVLCMVFSLCACGGNSDTDKDTDNDVNVENNQDDNDVDADVKDNEDTEDDTDAESTASFKVTVVDEGGNPVPSCMVQVCKDTCLPMITDANGVASFNVEITDGYKVEIPQVPEGYECVGENPFYLEAGATEYTFTLKAVQ